MAIESIGRFLIYIGVVLVVVGGFFILAGKIPWFGRLPGDIVYRRDGLTIYFPVATMVIVSLVLTLLLNIVWRR
jgi:hypothetical protein